MTHNATEILVIGSEKFTAAFGKRTLQDLKLKPGRAAPSSSKKEGAVLSPIVAIALQRSSGQLVLLNHRLVQAMILSTDLTEEDMIGVFVIDEKGLSPCSKTALEFQYNEIMDALFFGDREGLMNSLYDLEDSHTAEVFTKTFLHRQIPEGKSLGATDRELHEMFGGGISRRTWAKEKMDLSLINPKLGRPRKDNVDLTGVDGQLYAEAAEIWDSARTYPELSTVDVPKFVSLFNSMRTDENVPLEKIARFLESLIENKDGSIVDCISKTMEKWDARNEAS